MHFTIISMLLAASAAAFKIPTDAVNGLYLADIDDKPKIRREHTLLLEYNETTVPELFAKPDHRRDHQLLEAYDEAEGSELLERSPFAGQRKCNSGTHLDGTNYQQALAAFEVRAHTGIEIKKNKALYSKWGSVVVYACSWGGKNPIAEDEIQLAARHMDKDCGPLVAGIDIINDWAKIYGRDNIVAEVCWGHGES
ncbi:hypothetical protein F4779DRAFT_106914 [Xylariaceae sp. FL0662B]|nr:hypothetical protein F4779DRAFT_106914 [Xylariaceae sp. FL0662B]